MWAHSPQERGEAGRVVILNGASSAGKTSIARAWQAARREPWLRAGIDQFWSMVPDGLLDGDVAEPWFPRDEPRSASSTGVAFTRAWHRAVAALAQHGFNVIVDDVCFLPSFVADWREALHGLDVVWVAVHCPVDIIAERERARGDRFLNEGPSQVPVVHAHDQPYDLEIDTSITTTEEAVARISSVLATLNRA